MADRKHAPMVDWYNPWQLLDTAKKTAISTIIGENADPRLVTAPATGGKFFDYSQEFLINKHGDFEANGTVRKDIWIDYVSDVGDGWNPTYSVAYSLAKPSIKIPEHAEPLQRGEILIFGGDAVYPTATSDEYEKKLEKPYRMAFNASRNGTADDKTDLKKNPHVFALPGNHDWYDSLVAFQKIFCTHVLNDRIFAGGWRTRQKRSYFALKLPHNWWLLGVDLQLSHNIDTRQLQYFESIAQQMEKDDKIILCVPEPFWVKAIKYQGMTHEFEEKEKSIERLERLFRDKKAELKIYIAGDLHHYRRFESEDGRRTQKITAGGGGAFLHPTHDFDFKKFQARKAIRKDDFTLEAEYPPRSVSRRMDWKNLLGFIFRSPYFGILTAILYPFLALLIHGEIAGKFEWSGLFKATINRAIAEPITTLTVILTLLGLIFFTDSNSKLQKYLGGFIHGLFHLGAAFILGWAGFFAMLWIFGINTENYGAFRNNNPTLVSLVWFGCILLICGIGGYIIGSLIMGIYLFVSLHIFGRHDNEAFSALKIQDYKNFIRMHIDENGNLTIFPMKIEKVERKWDYEKNNGNEFYKPRGELKVELIENEPIKI